MPSYTLKDIKAARESVRADMVAEHNEMYGTNIKAQHLNGLEVEARLQTYLRFGVALDELEPVASEEKRPLPIMATVPGLGNHAAQPSVVTPTSDKPIKEPNHD